MRHGLCILPEHPWREAEQLWRAAEDLGADHVWTYDHLVWAGLPDAPWHSTVATLTAAAMVTERVQLGTLVSSPNFRHPATLARDVATLEDISGGRILLGVGAGGDLDAQILGETLTRGERSRRFREFVPLLQRCLREDHVSHEGEFYTVRDVRHHGPAGTPLVVAAQGPRAMALAVEYADGWVTTGPSGVEWAGQEASAAGATTTGAPAPAAVERWWAGVAELAERFSAAEAASPHARQPHTHQPHTHQPHSNQPHAHPPLDRYLTLDATGLPALSSVDFLTEQVGRAEEFGFTDVIVHWPRPEPPYQAELRVLEEYFGGLPS